MTRIAIVGAGQAGLLCAHALRQKGYEITLYTDKSADDFIATARPTGTAARFNMSLEWERELGLAQWEDVAPAGDAVHLTFCPELDNQLITLLGRSSNPWYAIDVRLQSAHWLRQLAYAGAEVVVEAVSLARLDEISAENDLTLVAAGKGDIRSIFPRDEQRCRYSTPQRNLTMICVKGVPMQMPYAPWMTPVKFNFFPKYGEAFWVPWLSKDLEPSWSLLFEAKPGGPIDRFGGAKSAQNTLDLAKEVIRDVAPWDYEWIKPAVICDENSWITGRFAPEVRQVVGTLPSGRHVMALGDTAQTLDPIAGQGANNGNKMGRVFVDAIAERGEGPFDPEWMGSTFDRFWERNHWTARLDSTLLEPLTKAGRQLLIAQYGSTGRPEDDSPQQRLANIFMDNFDDPATLTGAFHDDAEAKRVIREVFGTTTGPLAKGRVRIGLAQARQKLGLSANHPGT